MMSNLERATAQPGVYTHIPVLYSQVMEWLDPRPGRSYIDATVGLGGHAAGVLERSAPDGRLLAIDADPQALAYARQRLAPFGERVVFVQSYYTDLKRIARRTGFEQVDGILFDLGVSTLQLQAAERGFSFQSNAPLDMRMGPDADTTAEEIVNTWPEEELSRIIYVYGEERHARRVARAIVANRPIRSTGELAALVARVVGICGQDSPGDAHVSGFADCRQSRIGGADRDIARCAGTLGDRGASGGYLVSLAGRSDRQAIHGARIARLHLPAKHSTVRLRASGDAQAFDQENLFGPAMRRLTGTRPAAVRV
jgi:hypothetical protein